MSYLVLARKYRPQTFEDIVGQEHVTRTLQNAIKQGRLHHAFLFTGARGVGKTTAARILAKALSCDQAPTATPCNVCDACKEITSGSSVDVQEIDAASNNGVDNIRELRESIRYAPVRGKKKVYILDEVHMLSSGAWNALLKTLEEPPPHAVFVFATTDPHKLPATILSRVQRYDFKLVPTRRIVEHLQHILDVEKIGHDPSSLMLIGRESGGSVRDALSLLDQVIASLPGEKLTEEAAAGVLGVADRTLLAKLGRAVIGKDPGAALSVVDLAFTRGYDLPQLAQAFLGHLRDLVVVQAVKDPSSLIEGSTADLEELKSQAKDAPAGLAEMLFDRFAKTAEDVSKSPVPRYVLEVGLVELTRVEPLEPLATLVGKLDSLEARLEKGGARSGGGGGNANVNASVNANANANANANVNANANANANANVNVNANVVGTGTGTGTGTGGGTGSGGGNRIARLAEAANDVVLAGALHQARLLGWDEKKVSLGFESDFIADQVREKLNGLRAALTSLGAGTLAIEIIVGAMPRVELPGTETLIEVEQRKQDADREKRKQEAIEHPARKLVDEKLGGTWKDPVVDLEKDA